MVATRKEESEEKGGDGGLVPVSRSARRVQTRIDSSSSVVKKINNINNHSSLPNTTTSTTVVNVPSLPTLWMTFFMHAIVISTYGIEYNKLVARVVE